MRVKTRRRARQQSGSRPHLYLVPSQRRGADHAPAGLDHHVPGLGRHAPGLGRHAPGLGRHAPAGLDPHARGGRVLFEIPFVSTMRDGELDLLRRQLGFTMHVDHKLPADPNSPGFASLDHHSGLFLEHVADDDWWVVQARTWGRPSEQAIRGWHLRTALIARQIDPMVALPSSPTAVVG